MIKFKSTLSALVWAVASTGLAQTPAKELVKNNPITQLERGQAVDIYGDYSIVGSKFGFNGVNGSGMLFYKDQFVRDYKLSTQSDGVGKPKTVSIDQHALVVGAPDWQTISGHTRGMIGIAKRIYGNTTTHFEPNLTLFAEGSTDDNTGFGSAVSISDDWIVVGAPRKNVEGGVKLYYRNPSTGNWEDKGWLTLPNFANAPYRFRDFGGPKVKWDAGFGSSVCVNHQNLIVGAPGNGTFYIYYLDGMIWKYASEYTGTKDIGQSVAIGDEYAASSGNNNVEVVKKAYVNNKPVWPYLQSITTPSQVNEIAIFANRLVVGESNNTFNGQVTYYQAQGHFIPGTYTWVIDFVKTGKMYVNPAASTKGLQEVRLLGYAVAIYDTKVVAGAPNARYTGYADGAGFLGDFYQGAIAAKVADTEEIDNTTNATLIYPNPASDRVQIDAVGDIYMATATNSSGVQTVLPVLGNTANVSGLSSGIYVISIVTEAGIKTQNITIK